MNVSWEGCFYIWGICLLPTNFLISNYTKLSYTMMSLLFAASGLFYLKLIKIIGIIQFTNFYNYNLWIKLF